MAGDIRAEEIRLVRGERLSLPGVRQQGEESESEHNFNNLSKYLNGSSSSSDPIKNLSKSPNPSKQDTLMANILKLE